MNENPLKVSYDAEWDIVHVDGDRFAGDFFRRLRTFKPGDKIELYQQSPGKLSLKRVVDEKTQIA